MSRVAVVIPVFNQQEDLLRTLDSIDGQSCDLEVFVVDDGSTPAISVDTTRYRHPVHLITLLTNSGCTTARNTALEQILDMDFDYVALQDAGDTDIGERMQTEADFLDSNPGVAVVGSWARYVDRAGNLLYVHKPPAVTQAIRARMPFVSAFAHPATMIRLSALRRVGLYDPAYPIASDYEIFFRLTREFDTANLQRALINKEDHPDSLSLGQRRRSLAYRLRAQFQHFRLGSFRSYLGVFSTLILLLIPYSAVVAVKRRRGYAN